ncbi:uncharacterized protein GGS25DRAFT_146220 [Hypoxylon fragiforme]|uniref:uncharacterized protein n=1 Tax=Hypoxylon fragiforme TaxID=63214 RepID=UPI0020C65D4C|nr:uncharacterized protein GGS25DRAFT_146220 [Hypoxylon fragiforme]KAI2613017.1 hypothetical protein GGS25DRAFT_146220 [Hypoxylon fragiforme]
MDDPWDWDVDRVVQELCSEYRSWEPPTSRFNFAAPDLLAPVLREQEVDGHTLITYGHKDLCNELGIRIVKHKAILKHAIDIFRSRSQRYRLHQKRLSSDFENDNENQMNDSLKPQLAPTPTTATSINGQSDNPHLAFDSSEPEMPARKKRRVAPTSFKPTRNIPVEVNGKYLGQDSYTNLDVTTDIESLDEGDSHFNSPVRFIQRRHLPHGRKVQVHRLYKRWLLRDQGFKKDLVMKADTMPRGRAHIPAHDDIILPLYGDSDQEYDPKSWKEVKAENLERKKAKSRRGPSLDEIQTVLDQAIMQFASNWKERKLPKLLNKGHQIWTSARKGGLKISLRENHKSLHRCISRIAKLRDELMAQSWGSIASLKEMTPVMQQTVEDREYYSSLINIIKAPNAPAKISTAQPRTSARSVRKTTQIASDEELLTSESESESESELSQFIVDDEPSPSAQLHDDFLMATGEDVDTSHMQEQPASQRQQKEVAVDVEPSVIIDLTQLDDDDDDDDSTDYPKTQSETQKPDSKFVTPSKRSKITSRETGGPTRVKSQKVELEPRRSPIILGIDDLEPNKKMVAEEIAKFFREIISILFSVVRFQKPDKVWADFVVLPIRKHQYPRTANSSWEHKLTIVGYTLLRTMEIYRTGVCFPIKMYKEFTVETREKVETRRLYEGEDTLGTYLKFLSDLADRFDWTPITDLQPLQADKLEPQPESAQADESEPQPPQVDGLEPQSVEPTEIDENQIVTSDFANDDDEEEEELSPSKKRKKFKKKPIRNQEAKILREDDHARVAEQGRRRKVLRDKLAATEASGVTNLGSQRDMIINEIKEDSQGFIYIHPEIAKRIKPHQVAGVRFMWDQIVDSRSKQGCLLAHTMGLGKTMQVITLLVAIAEAAGSDDPTISCQIPEELKESKTLVLCPPALGDNWMDELLFWTPEEHKLGEFFKVDSATPPEKREAGILAWDERGGVLIIGFQLFKDFVKIEQYREILLDGPNLVVADEAHYLKNPKAQLHVAASRFRTQSRIALTGSPLANNLEEYHSMINWVAPNYLSDIKEFRAEYSIPVGLGLQKDATLYQRRRALKMLRVLTKEVSPKVQRTTIAVLKHDIPTKQEFLITVPLTSLQRRAYEAYIKYHQSLANKHCALASIDILCILCAHPSIFVDKLQNEKEDASNETVKDPTLTEELISNELTLLRKEKNLNSTSHSWKILILVVILEECKRVGDSVLIFSQSIPTLNYLEQILRKGKFSVERLDGSTRMNTRQTIVKDFNQGNTDVFLVSTKAGGLGLNITGANRVVIFDARFNPQVEQQAVGRAYRIGQKKAVFVYRFLCGGTLEDSVHSIAVHKKQLADRTIDAKHPIPKSETLSTNLKMPTDPEQRDINGYVGRDIVLDKVIEKHGRGIRAITTMDTFEEEALEDAVLTREDYDEANKLIAQNAARRSGVALQIPVEDQGSANGWQPIQSPASSTQRPNPVNSIHNDQRVSNAVPNWETTPTLQVPQPPLSNASHQHQPLQPIQGTSTHIGRPAEPDLDNGKDFLWELGRRFSANGSTSNKLIGQQIVHAIAAEVSSRDLGRSERKAIIDAASSARFVEAMCIQLFSPLQLVGMKPLEISIIRTRWDSLTEAEWETQKITKGRQSKVDSHIS